MNINRRGFLLGSTAAAALAGCATNGEGTHAQSEHGTVAGVPNGAEPEAFSAMRQLAPGEKRRVALIGYGIQQRSALLPQFLGKAGAAGAEKLVKVVAS